jgi:hypothetical protein
MSNQIVISSGAKVRNLDGVLTGTSGIVNSVPLGAANGVATLDSGGKVPVSQLPSSVVTYLGTWNAATNTPTLVNGTGDAGDMYICNVAGTVNFGAGPVTFAVGDWVLYGSGTWQKSNGQNGTVTSVGVSRDGDALSITGSPITTAGTINIGFTGSNAQYINGEGDLVTFPSLSGFVTDVTGTAPIVSSGGTTPAISIPAASSTVDGYLDNADWTTFNNKQNAITLTTTGTSGVSTLIGSTLNIPNYSTDLSGYVPYIGATANVNLGTFDLTADVITGATGSFASSGGSNTFAINHSSGSGIALNITKGGNGEGLYINKTSGSGNAATIIGTLNATTLVKSGGTSSQFLKADGSVDASAYITLASLSAGTGISYNNTTGVITSTITQYTDALARASISLTTTGTSGAATYNNTTGVFNIPQYQEVLTNPVTGTGNNNYVAKFSSTGSTIANSIIRDDATRAYINQENIYFGVDAQDDVRLGLVKKSGLDPTIAYADVPFTISQSSGASIAASNTFVPRLTIALGGAATFTNSITATKGTFSGNTSEPLRIERSAGATIYGKFSLAISASSNFSIYDAVADADRLIISSTGNLGIGVVPSAWESPFKPIQIGTYGQYIAGQTNGPDIKIGSNHYYNGTNYIYTTANGAVQLNVGGNSGFQFNVADVGEIGAAVTFTSAMSVNRNGNVLIGSITDNGSRLQVTGSATFTSDVTLSGASGTRTLSIVNNTSGNAVLSLVAAGSDGGSITYNRASSRMIFSNSSASDAMSITSGGNLLIGTTSFLQSDEKVGIETDTNTPLITKFTGGAATGWAGKFWNNATTGDNLIIEFLTESVITSRGSIRYDRGGNRLNILGGGSGLLFTGASTFANSVTSGGGLNVTGYTNSSGANYWEIGSNADGYYINAINRTTGNYNKPAYFDAQKLIFNSGSAGNVLINTSTNVSGGGALQVNGNVNINGVFQINGTTIGGGGGSGVTGSGTTNFVTKWTGGTTIGNSIIQDTGTNVGIGAAPLSFTKLYVTDTGVNITGGNAIAGTSIKGVMVENSNNNDESIGLWFRTGNNHLSGISGQRFNSAGGWGTDLRFYTHENATVDLTYTRERMRITSEGSILINRLTDAGYTFDVNGTGRFTGDLTAASILAAGSITAASGFFDTSDSRLKILIKDYNQPKGIENVAARMYVKNNRKELGYFAQEVQEILPSAVAEGNDGFLTLSYSQVHTAKIAYLEKEVAELKELIKSLIK